MEWNHQGMTITVETSGRFTIEGDDDKRWFDTLELAKKEVNSRAAVEVKARHTDLAMPVLDEQGRRHTIRGINRTSSKLQGVPERGVSTLYYPTERVAELIAERQALLVRSAELSDLLHGTTVPTNMGYGRIRVEEYDDKIDRLRKAYDGARGAAEALTPGEDKVMVDNGIESPRCGVAAHQRWTAEGPRYPEDLQPRDMGPPDA